MFKRTVSLGRSFWVPTTYVLVEKGHIWFRDFNNKQLCIIFNKHTNSSLILVHSLLCIQTSKNIFWQILLTMLKLNGSDNSWLYVSKINFYINIPFSIYIVQSRNLITTSLERLNWDLILAWPCSIMCEKTNSTFYVNTHSSHINWQKT